MPANAPVSIRAGMETDLDAVLELWQSDDVHPTVTDTRDALGKLMQRGEESVLVAVDESGVVVGSVLAAWDGWRGSLYRLVVHPSARRRGIGRQLVQQALGSLQARGCMRVSILVVADDQDANAFWRRCSAMGVEADSAPKMRLVVNFDAGN